MPSFGGLDPGLATALLLALNGLLPLPRAAVCIPAGAALGWVAIGPSMLGTAIGFALCFALSRFALRAQVERSVMSRPRLAAVMRAVDTEGWRLLALLRLGSPVPGPIINAACGVIRMGFGTFMVTSVLAVAPQTLLFIYLGLAGRQALAARSLLSVDTLLAVAGIALTLVALWRFGVAAKRQAMRVMTATEASAVSTAACTFR